MSETSLPVSSFRRLFQIDVSPHIEKKGQFSYLSWPFAVAQLRLADPAAMWEVKRFDGLPYLFTELGYFVEVAVTVAGVTLSQIHPVLDSRNQPILAPTPFEINTSIQRCLVKAIALHGLGLSVYAGEDLPVEGLVEPTKPATPSQPATVMSLPKSGDLLTPNQLRYLQRLMVENAINSDDLLAHFGFEALEQIPKADVNRVIKAIEAYRRKEVA